MNKKKEYLSPAIFVQTIDTACSLLAGSTGTTSNVGTEVSGPTTGHEQEDTSKSNDGLLKWDDEEGEW